MTISAALVKTLRDRTGAGMMECKKALVEANGDLDLAAENMRKSGLAKADKKAGRVAAEGVIAISQDESGHVAMVEVNCETDFVAGGTDFRDFTDTVLKLVLKNNPADLAVLMTLASDGGMTLEETRRSLIAKIGENITVRRFMSMQAAEGQIGTYCHGTRIGVLVNVKGGDDALCKDLAMHIAASRPLCVSPADVPADVQEKEREIYRAQALESGKPAEIVEKMVEGRMRKYLGEITLVGQPFVKNPDISVGQLLKEKSAVVTGFSRFEVSEGIEKKEENFADEVMAQVRGTS